jgi:ribosomal protein L4
MSNIVTTSSNKSAKRLAREAKLLKKLQQQRTMVERNFEIEKLYAKLQELGITREMMGDFNKIADDFVDFGIGASGIYKIDGIKYELAYLLSNDKKHQVSTMLHPI